MDNKSPKFLFQLIRCPNEALSYIIEQKPISLAVLFLILFSILALLLPFAILFATSIVKGINTFDYNDFLKVGYKADIIALASVLLFIILINSISKLMFNTKNKAKEIFICVISIYFIMYIAMFLGIVISGLISLLFTNLASFLIFYYLFYFSLIIWRSGLTILAITRVYDLKLKNALFVFLGSGIIMQVAVYFIRRLQH
ncbi:MAG: hypothetical protein MUF05_05940 [Candidatus Omnitrophica bacterium]|jgi:hypothetical protein|nr:hypothetical protein [Candidatus Omnitrophota bacterium]